MLFRSGKTVTADGNANPMMNQISGMMQACMTGDVAKLGRGWDMKIEQVDNNYHVTLIPTDRRVKKYIGSMFMNFNGNDLTLEVLRMVNANGGYTEYVFTEKIINESIAQSYFTL